MQLPGVFAYVPTSSFAYPKVGHQWEPRREPKREPKRTCVHGVQPPRRYADVTAYAPGAHAASHPPPPTYTACGAPAKGGQGAQNVRFRPTVCVPVGHRAHALLLPWGAYQSLLHTTHWLAPVLGAVPAPQT